jgi:spore coat polysaccharide biosynthesis predicted glycosyltransferase SpsG
MSKKMKILFSTAGGKARNTQLGTGHIHRCMNLADCMTNFENYFLLEDYGNAKEIIIEKGFKNILSINPNLTLKSKILKIEKIVKEQNIDVVIFDKFNIENLIIKKIRMLTKVVVISDLKKIDYNADMVVNGFIGFKNKKIKNKFGSKCILGPSYQILNKNYAKKNRIKKTTKLLVTFGGFDESNLTELFLKVFIKFKFNIKIKVILGPVSIKSKNIKEIKSKFSKTIKIIDKEKSLQNVISSSEYGICGGGITTYEFASMNVPFVIIYQHEHQQITGKIWEKKFKIKNLGFPDNKIESKIETYLKNIQNETISEKKNFKNVVDGKGVFRVAKEIKNLLNN